MNVSNLEVPRTKTLPALTWLRPGPNLLAELDRLESGRRLAPVSRDEPVPPIAASPVASFTPDEIRSFQNDDAMASSMIGVILGLAFLVLLSLVVGVSVWTQLVTR